MEKFACCDTSFLYALYTADAHTGRALALLRSLQLPLTLSVLNVFELENAFRFAGWRGIASSETVTRSLAIFEADCRDHRMLVRSVDLSRVFEEARRLSSTYTFTGGHRNFDILIVAAALCLGAGRFFTFDHNQRRLAASEGLILNS